MINTVKISEINKDLAGKQVIINALVDDRRDTTGPSIFRLYDGSGFMNVKSFSPGRRAFPELKQGDKISAKVFIRTDGIRKEGELLGYSKLSPEEEKLFLENLKKNEYESTKPEVIDFSINSKCYRKLNQRFVDAARLIKKSIIESRMIVLKHHADCDGYSGAISLEKAILSLIKKEHGKSEAEHWYYKRSPMKKPFYEYVDALKDLSSVFDSISHNKPPLIIVVDNGSTEQDILALKELKLYEAKVIIVDHHLPVMKDGTSLTDKYVDVHINPHLVGFSSDITAGMLAYELARFVDKKLSGVDFLPALSGVGDHSSCREFEEYLKLAENSGFDISSLKKLAACVDFEAYSLGYYESRSMVKDLLTENELQKKIINTLFPYIEEIEEQQMKVLRHTAKREIINNVSLITLNLDDVNLMSDFPPPGKITGMCFRLFDEPNTIVLGYSNNYVSIRTNLKQFNVNDLLLSLQSKLPYGMISGGGHPHAGTIKFVKAVKDEVLKSIKEYLLSLTRK